MREFIHNPALGITPVGFIDDDPREEGKLVSGYPVLIDLNHLEQFLEGNSISGIVISTANISRKKLDYLKGICNSRNIDLHRLQVNLAHHSFFHWRIKAFF